MDMYSDSEYAQNRLQGTIVRRENKAIHIETIDLEVKKTSCKYVELISGKSGKCYLKELDINPVPLGYTNDHGRAYYLCRRPMRQDWKQGLRENTLVTINGVKVGVSSQSLGETIEGQFPKIKTVLETLHTNYNGIDSMAFTRNFCLDRQMNLIYKGKFSVGMHSDKQLKLLEKFDWLVDVFEAEVLNA